MAEQSSRARHLGAALIVAWAVGSGAIAVSAFPDAHPDARLLVVGASLVGVAASLAAAALLWRGSIRAAGVFLVISVVTPTDFYAYANLVALAAGLVLAIVGRRSSPRPGRREHVVEGGSSSAPEVARCRQG